jgi:hypothetical protein
VRKFLIPFCFISVIANAKGFDHGPWNELLKRNVVLLSEGHASKVNYKNFKADEFKLSSYLETLSSTTKADFDGWSESERLAFLINAYNAFTIQLVLTKYPEIKSIKDIGWVLSPPWKKRFFKLFGQESHLSNVENDLIRKKFKEPRIHFALNCASIGCPMLFNEAYNPERLDKQLEQGLKSFLSDSTRNTYNKESNSLQISKIFDWYSEDFEKGYQGYNQVVDVFSKYAELLTNDIPSQKAIKNKKVLIKYLNYDWNLNSL